MFNIGDPNQLGWPLVLAIIWSIPWKSIALWKSARKNQLGWFIFFIFVNTLGLLEAAYIFYFSESGLVKNQRSKNHHKKNNV